MTCLWAGKVTSGTQQMSIRFGVSTILEPMHLHRTADACAGGPSRSLTAADSKHESARRLRYLMEDAVLDGSDISTALCPPGLSPDVSSRRTHRDAPSSQASWNAYFPTLHHADAGACAASRLGPGRPCSQHDSSTICPGPVRQRRRRHALHTRQDPVELLHCSEFGEVRQLYHGNGVF